MATTFEYTHAPLPAVWPGKQRAAGYVRPASPFRTQWSGTERLLLAELRHLKAKDVVIAVDVQGLGYFNTMHRLRADARPKTPAVILSFTRPDGVRLNFPCDKYRIWQDNVHAIALALESLRRVDRFEVTRGDEQYVGFAQLGAGKPGAMTQDDAAALLEQHSGLPAHTILAEVAVAGVAIRMAKRAAHPDAGGSDDAFVKVGEAAEIIGTLHGGIE